VLSVVDDRLSYQRTCEAWAHNLDGAREQIVSRWGEATYRRFRLYLWGSVAAFGSQRLQAYRWLLELP